MVNIIKKLFGKKEEEHDPAIFQKAEAFRAAFAPAVKFLVKSYPEFESITIKRAELITVEMQLPNNKAMRSRYYEEEPNSFWKEKDL